MQVKKVGMSCLHVLEDVSLFSHDGDVTSSSFSGPALCLMEGC